MSTIDDVKKMQSQGKTNDEIQMELKNRGLSDANVSDAMSQAQIKEAVGGKPPIQMPQTPDNTQEAEVVSSQPPSTESAFPVDSGKNEQYSAESGQGQTSGVGGMQPSMLAQSSEGGVQNYGVENYDTGGEYGVDGGYQPYADTISSDVISEIAEQVVSEKLSAIQDELERTIDFRTVAEANLSSLNNRLKKIEKTMDVLQISLLQKVGEYVNDVKDLKGELIENQKSMHALAKGHLHKAPHHTSYKKHP